MTIEQAETHKHMPGKILFSKDQIPRRILCIRIPHFYLQLAEGYLKIKPGTPLIISSGSLPESYVVDLSKDLLCSGIKRGTLLKDIKTLKVKEKIIPAPYGLSEKIRTRLLELLSEFSPEVKSSSSEEYFVNLTGTRKLMGREIDTATRIAFKILSYFKLKVSSGIGSTPQLARMASVIAGSGGVYEILPGAENLFLAHLSPLLIPDISSTTKRKLLNKYNIRTISELWQMNSEELLTLFGKEGLLLHNYSRGEGKIYRTRCTEKKHLRESRIIPVATNNPCVILSVIQELLSVLCKRSRNKILSPGALSLSFTYQDNYTKTFKRKLKAPSNSGRDIYPELKKMSDKLLARRVKVKKVELIFSDLRVVPQQQLLFEEHNSQLKLNETLNNLPCTVGVVALPTFDQDETERTKQKLKTSVNQSRDNWRAKKTEK